MSLDISKSSKSCKFFILLLMLLCYFMIMRFLYYSNNGFSVPSPNLKYKTNKEKELKKKTRPVKSK
ncbi:hypothetical protein NBO_10g0084 [Nosema bombycis CQ1]|uniref:Uncharacterized protein n=1 Tax=Nosema bombycis (strain CQ1 / CVCC 102059) TaxID=578461 RepID=R0MAU7_NOSB1|nr:hypothetical protein NBO_10g0084 [Nosema bombycis CQ1]|eukprot:EOB15094.1 hypothetical protein NBO_10g0084 [Nosema bombycis CQ1]